MSEVNETSRRGRKPRDVESKEVNAYEPHDPVHVEGGVTENSQWPSGGPVDLEDARVIESGDPIEVDTDDNGYATETVVYDQPLMGTDRTTRILIATKGALYNG